MTTTTDRAIVRAIRKKLSEATAARSSGDQAPKKLGEMDESEFVHELVHDGDRNILGLLLRTDYWQEQYVKRIKREGFPGESELQTEQEIANATYLLAESITQEVLSSDEFEELLLEQIRALFDDEDLLYRLECRKFSVIEFSEDEVVCIMQQLQSYADGEPNTLDYWTGFCDSLDMPSDDDRRALDLNGHVVDYLEHWLKARELSAS